MSAADVRTRWLTERRNGIGASDVAGILGLSVWSSPWSIWADKTGLLPLDGVETEPQEFGRRAEQMLTTWFTDRTGVPVTGVQHMAHHPEHPWAFATVDGFTPDGVLEIKTTSESEAEWTPNVPDAYACQAAWQMWVSGVDVVWFCVLHFAFGRPRMRVYRFDRDETDITFVVERVTAFWHDHVLTGIPPEVDGSDATTDAICEVWPEQVPGSVVHADLDTLSALALLRHDEVEAKALETRIAERRNYLRAVLADAETLIDPTDLDAKGAPRRLATFKAQTTTRVDAKALRERLPRTAARFSNTTSSRVLRITPTKES